MNFSAQAHGILHRRALFVIAFAILCLPVSSPAEGVIISEFMASNRTAVRDEDGDASDWIELYNEGPEAVSLSGWHLTDDPNEPEKWPLPPRELEAGAILLVFASGKDRRDPAGELHTSFKLSRSGEPLQLTDGAGNLRTSFLPDYPEQRTNSSYGYALNQSVRELLPLGSPGRLFVPLRLGEILTPWREVDFDDASWFEVRSGIGFDLKEPPTFHDFIETDVSAQVLDRNATILVRFPFEITDRASVRYPRLRVQYEAGFAAYINGTEVIRRNISRLRYNAPSDDPRSPERAILFEEIPLPADVFQDGANVLAFHLLNDDISSPDLLLAPILEDLEPGSVVDGPVLVGPGQMNGNGPAPVFFAHPTPGRPNPVQGETGLAAPPSLSHPGGMFLESLTLEISNDSPQADVRYTLDGSIPDDFSPRYQGPLELTSITEVKARTFEQGLVPSDVVSGTYLTTEPNTIDYTSELPLVVVRASRTISSTLVDMHFRLIDVGEDGMARLNDPADFVGNGAIKIRGSSTEGRPKKSYSLELRDAFGEDDDAELLGMPADSDWVLYGPHQDSTLVRNAFIYALSNQMGRYAVRTRYCEVFVHQRGSTLSTADYVGLYVLMEKIKRGEERVDVEALESNDNDLPEVAGGYIFKRDRADPGDVGFVGGGDQLRYVYPKEDNISEAQATWLKSYIDTAIGSMVAPEFGYEAFIDVGSWIDHHILNEFTLNPDGFEHSAYMFKRRGGKFALGPIWDFNYALGYNNMPPEGWTVNRHWTWFGRLFNDPLWVERYTGRWRELRAGPMQIDNLLALVDTAAAEARKAQARNFERWPGSRAADGWESDIQRLKDWIRTRVLWMDGDLTLPPKLLPTPGRVPVGTQVSIEADEGSVYYTLDGSDPRGEDGNPSATAIEYTGPVTIEENIRIRVRARLTTDLWSQTVDGTYITMALPVVISEIMYNPPTDPLGSPLDRQEFEFIELLNTSDTTVDLAGVRFDRRPAFSLPTGEAVPLGPGERVVIARNSERFTSRYGTESIRLLGEYGGSLSNLRQTLTLRGPLDEEVFSVRYEDSWHPTTDGDGASLILVDTEVSTAGWSRAEAWRPSTVLGGSPGQPDPEPTGVSQLPGDLNQDKRLNITDALTLLRYLSGAGADLLPCTSAAGNLQLADADASGEVDISDAVLLVTHLFLRGPPPALGRDCVAIEGCPSTCEDTPGGDN